jgi:hypothetical protein
MTSRQESPTTSYLPSTPLRRRFSEGVERKPPAPSGRRVGRFSDGLARSQRGGAPTRVGGFAAGIMHRPDARPARRVGSFSDGLATTGAVRATVPRIDVRGKAGAARGANSTWSRHTVSDEGYRQTSPRHGRSRPPDCKPLQ